MPAGANIKYTSSKQLAQRVASKLGYPAGTFDVAKAGKLCTKAGAPASNTANDEPNAVGDICWDSTNNRVHIVTAYTNSTTHTWVQISAN